MTTDLGESQLSYCLGMGARCLSLRVDGIDEISRLAHTLPLVEWWITYWRRLAPFARVREPGQSLELRFE